MMEVLSFFFNSLVFPGLLFASLIGLLYAGIDRKVTGHMQHRIGPPIWQEYLDVGKLMGKEDITPSAAQSLVFNVAPLIALGAVTTVMLLLPVNSAQPALTAVADLIVIIYLLNIPAICLMLGGYSSGGPFGSVGAARYVVQLFSYEFVFILAIIAVIARVGSLDLTAVVGYQAQRGWLILDLRLIPALIAMIISAQGKLMRVPFDIPEAETEIVHGALTEYSGPKLAIWRIVYNIETLVVAGFIAALFLGGPVAYTIGGFQIPGVADFLIKTLIIVLITTILRNIMARLRIDQALKFYWTFAAFLAVLSLMLVLVVP
ncbi:MAG: NADH-quinone oxidoreductase subunit H [Candidatus Hodarchaeaceae archaeon]|nr:NADH-quinone oxidoreductase subunit H [Candidatus Hodarchaeaceae archaeon]